MPNEVLQKVKSNGQIIFADHATDFVGGASGTSLEVATATDVQMDMTDVADTAAQQSAQADLTATRARQFALTAAVEMAATPTTVESIDFYWNASNQSTAGDGNSGYASGSDAAYAGGVAELAEGLKQLIYIGSMIVSADATGTVQVAFIGVFSPPHRYGSLIVVNESGAAFHSDAVETHFVLDPIIDEIQ
jgi:hypothetical protein